MFNGTEMQHRPSRLIVHFRVLYALLIREMITRYGRSSLGYVWAVLEPVGVITLLTVLFMQIADAPPYGHSFALFYASGYLAFHWVIDISTVAARSVHVNRPLLAFPSVTALDTVLARLILQSLTGLSVAALILAGILAATGEPLTLSPGPLMQGFAMAVLLAAGTGIFNCWAFTVSKGWELAWGILSRPLLLVSCVFYSFEALPTDAREVLWYNPLIHVVGLLRSGIYPGFDHSHVSPEYVALIALVLLIPGLTGMRVTRARMAAP